MKSRQARWNASNPETLKKANSKYSAKRPTLTFRPTPEILDWLQSQRQDGEGHSALVNRQLKRLKDLS